MMVKSGLEFLFWNSPIPFRVAAAQRKKIYPERLNWHGRLAEVNFKTKNSRPLFTIIFRSKMVISRLTILVRLLKITGFPYFQPIKMQSWKSGKMVALQRSQKT